MTFNRIGKPAGNCQVNKSPQYLVLIAPAHFKYASGKKEGKQ